MFFWGLRERKMNAMFFDIVGNE